MAIGRRKTQLDAAHTYVLLEKDMILNQILVLLGNKLRPLCTGETNSEKL